MKDKEFASDIYTRAEEKVSGTNDLMDLAAQILKNLEDKDRASGIYRKAAESVKDFKG